MQDFDVIVIGGGNAGLCAALSAREQGARVALLERAPEELRGGNSAHTGGAFRVAYRGVDDLRQLMPDLLDSEIESSDFGSYTQDDFYGELAAQSQYRADPEVLDTVVSQSLDTLGWMTRQGVRFMPIYGRQAFKVDGKYKFWGGLTVEVSGGGLGLVEALMRRAERSGIELHYACRAQRIGHAAGRWQVVALHHLFGSDETSSRAAPVQERIPAAYAALGSDAAARLGLADGALLSLKVGGRELRLPLRVIDELADGLLGLPAGFDGIPPLAGTLFAEALQEVAQ